MHNWLLSVLFILIFTENTWFSQLYLNIHLDVLQKKIMNASKRVLWGLDPSSAPFFQKNKWVTDHENVTAYGKLS